MMYSTNKQFERLSTLGHAKFINMWTEKANRVDFQTSNICQNLSFLCSLQYYVFHSKILQSDRVHHWLHLGFFHNFLRL
jgi:hypothetical protein